MLFYLFVTENSMYVFGGCTSTSTTFNDLWRLDLNKRQWIRPLTMGTYPSPKACASLVCYKDALILFGGWTHPSPYPLHQVQNVTQNNFTAGNVRNCYNIQLFYIFRHGGCLTSFMCMELCPTDGHASTHLLLLLLWLVTQSQFREIWWLYLVDFRIRMHY